MSITGKVQTVRRTLVQQAWLVALITLLGGPVWATAPGSSATLADAPDFRFVPVPDPLAGDNPPFRSTSMPEPAVGESFQDQYFGTTQTRVTPRGKIRHEYSRHDPFNIDKSLIILINIADGSSGVYRTALLPYSQPSNLVRGFDLQEPRWDPDDPALLWGHRNFQIIRLDAWTGQETVVKDFAADPRIGPIIAAEPDLIGITMMDEGEPSRDFRIWPFGLRGSADDDRLRYIFVWSRDQDRILGLRSLSAAESNIDWVGASASGNYVLIGGLEYNGGDLAGLTMADLSLTRFHRLDFATSHSDVGLDSQGREVVVMQNVRTDFVDLIPVDWNTQPILEPGGGYAGTNRTPLVRLYYQEGDPFSMAPGNVHISCGYPGYALISVSVEPGYQDRNWLDRSLVLVRLNQNVNPQAVYLAKTHGSDAAYFEEAHGVINRDGSLVLWSTNWDWNPGAEEVFLIRLDMPPDWPGLLPGGGGRR